MTTWLWIIGIAAFAWPVMVAVYLEARLSKSVATIAVRSENSHSADLQAKALGEKISNLQAMIEHQDALIALLWYKVFGLGHAERIGKADLAEFFHQSPGWYVNAMELPGAYDTLCRYENYPWGKNAEWLRREDFRN